MYYPWISCVPTSSPAWVRLLFVVVYVKQNKTKKKKLEQKRRGHSTTPLENSGPADLCKSRPKNLQQQQHPSDDPVSLFLQTADIHSLGFTSETRAHHQQQKMDDGKNKNKR